MSRAALLLVLGLVAAARPAAAGALTGGLQAVVDSLEQAGNGVELGLEVVDAGTGVLLSHDPEVPRPTASAIKSAILVDLLTQRAETLAEVPAGVDGLLAPGGHPAFAGFSGDELDRARRELGGKSYLELARVMMGRTDASNPVYNAACNLIMIKLGGPGAITRRLHDADPAFAGFDVNRYMLQWNGDGDNTATPRALVSLYRMAALGRVPGLDANGVTLFRELTLDQGDGGPGSVFEKAGTLYPKPLVRVHAGYVVRPGGALIYAVMGEVPDPGDRNPSDLFVELMGAVDRVADAARRLAPPVRN